MTTTTTTTPALARPELALDVIELGDNVRADLGDVADLAASIRSVGLVQPLTVEELPAGRFRLVAGHRRFAALQRLGWDTAPVSVVNLGATDTTLATPSEPSANRLALQLVENLQRQDLTPIEEAEGLARLVDLTGSQKAAAAAVGRSQAHVSKRLKLRSLPENAAVLVAAGTIPLDQAVELAQLATLDAKAAAKVAAAFENGTGGPSELRWATQRAEADQQRAAWAATASTKAQPVAPDAAKGWKPLEGWDGVAVDAEDHASEPCHRLVAVKAWSDDGEAFRPAPYCADPDRHAPEGASTLKAAVSDFEAAAARREQADAEQAQRDARKRAARAERVTQLVAGYTDRNAALRALALALVNTYTPTPRTISTAAAAVGVELPQEPAARPWLDRPAWEAWEASVGATVAALKAADLYRLALAVVVSEAITYTNEDHLDLDQLGLPGVAAAGVSALGFAGDDLTGEEL